MKAAALSILLLATACTKSEPEYKELRSPFQLLAERIGLQPPCSTEIPGEWSPSLPVPALVDGRLKYRVFFRGWEGNAKTGIKIRDAEGDAAFDPDGQVTQCARRAQRGAYIPEPKLPTADRDAFDARVRALYGSIEEMGRLYARGVPVLGNDRARVKAFETEFFSLTPAGHAASYRALNPAFWSWVEKNRTP